MGLEDIIQAIIALFVIIIFLVVIFPPLAKATGADMTFGIIAMVILAIGLIGFIISLIKRG